MADDMGYSDLGCYGSEISTPNIDRLASEGMRFTQFYNAARCCPTRAALLTGLYPHQTGMGGMITRNPDNPEGPYQGYLNNNCVTLAEVLKSTGYDTYMSGKWHVGELEPHWPINRGFDKYYGLISGAMNYFDISKSKRKGLERVFVKDGEPFIPPNEGFYATDAFTDEALKFLDDHKNKNPFFLYLAYNAPHWPLHALPEDIEKYIGKYKDGWLPLREKRWKRQIELGIIDSAWGMSPQDPEAIDWSNVENKDRMDMKMAIYAAQIDRMDANIGRIIKKLEEMEILDNTLIMFLSDNGACAEEGPLGYEALGGWDGELGTKDSYASYGRSWSNASNTPFRLHKKWVHEGGIATPFVVRYPKIIASNQITDQVGHVIDLMATILDLSNAEYPESINQIQIKPLEGKSLLPILKGEKRIGHETLFWEHLGNKAIRMGDWKLVSVADGKWELYNFREDRTELNDLSDDYPQIKTELISKYNKWSKRIGVKN
jgi:arylsulfatase